MRTAANIGRLTGTGKDPRTAQVRGEAEIESRMYELHNASLKWTLGTCFMMVGLIYSIARFVK